MAAISPSGASWLPGEVFNTIPIRRTMAFKWRDATIWEESPPVVRSLGGMWWGVQALSRKCVRFLARMSWDTTLNAVLLSHQNVIVAIKILDVQFLGA